MSARCGWGWLAAAATAPATGPATTAAGGEAAYAGPATVALMAVGLCVLAAWVARCIARPDRLLLRRCPGRLNRLNPFHILLMLLVMWTTSILPSVVMLIRGVRAESQPAQSADGRLSIAIGAAVAVGWLVVGLPLAAGTFRQGIRRGLGLSARRWLYDGIRSILAYLAILPVCIGLVLAMSYLFERWGIPIQYHPILRVLSALPPGWKALAVLATVVLAPLAEEVFFRGLVQSMVRRVAGPWTAILLGSALFAAMHYTQPQAIPSLFALAVALGYNYERTGRLFAPILTHAIFNAVNLALWPA